MEFVAQNWAVAPVALAVNEPRPADITKQQWQITLSGVGIVDVKGQGTDWLGKTIVIYPDMNSPMKKIIQHFGVPVPSDTPYVHGSTIHAGDVYPLFLVEYMVPFVALSSVFDQNTAVNAGFSVNAWRPHQYVTLIDSRPGGNAPTLRTIFNGVDADLAVRDSDAWIHRISYHITLMGKIVFAKSTS